VSAERGGGKSTVPDIIGEQIDRLVTLELKNRGMPHDFLRHLYDATLEEGGGRSLCMRAAEGLVERVAEGDVVFLVTGAASPPMMPKGESDAPPGAVALARAVLGSRRGPLGQPHPVP
jgi:hypothetical protein